ncbi:MAG: hypothetical protein GC160_22155 [Acidobacteria bacterium]|nr:hypothetical protein [Acidobacteriota bacterium]
MHLRTLAKLATLTAALSVGLLAADSGQSLRFASVSPNDAVKELSGFEQLETPAAMWIWSDKYVYQPGEQLSLNWTIKPNGDLIPYTLVAYRQNNQTGEKTYLPNGTTEATDIFGNTVEQGFNIVRLPSAEKQTLVGSGGMFPAITLPSELGMHTVVVEVRDYTGGRVVKAAYWKVGVVEGFEDITGDVTDNRTLVNTKAYRLSGLMIVRAGGVLNIEPGTFVIGQPGSQPPSAIIVSNSGRLEAKGTRSRPIIMTSSPPFGQRRAGDWGGVVMMGQAPVNWPSGTGNIEGLPPSDDTVYGGTDPEHNCGSMSYVRLEFAGAELRPNDEINAFTWAGCGKQTSLDHLQAHYGLDDSFEWFGGNNDAKYLLSSYPRDDNFDSQIGWTGRVQFFAAIINADNSNRGFEWDNNENDFGAVPLNSPTFYNGTLVGDGDITDQGVDEGTVAGIYLRRGAGGSINNVVVQNWVDGGININDDATQARLDAGELSLNGILMWKNGMFSGAANDLAGQVNDRALTYVTTQAPNMMVADPMLRRPFEFSDIDFRPMLGSPVFRANWVQPPDDGFFDQTARYNGAFADVDWTEEWTTTIQEQDMAK